MCIALNPCSAEVGICHLNTLDSDILTLILVSEEVGDSHRLGLYGITRRYGSNLIECKATHLNCTIILCELAAREVNLELRTKCEGVVGSQVELQATRCILNIQALLRGEVVKLHIRDYNTLNRAINRGILAQSQHLGDSQALGRLLGLLGSLAATLTKGDSLTAIARCQHNVIDAIYARLACCKLDIELLGDSCQCEIGRSHIPTTISRTCKGVIYVSPSLTVGREGNGKLRCRVCAIATLRVLIATERKLKLGL